MVSPNNFFSPSASISCSFVYSIIIIGYRFGFELVGVGINFDLGLHLELVPQLKNSTFEDSGLGVDIFLV
jgi:hypothetical protein